jgi:DNA-binding NarL/FixJ family response regulator
MERVITGYVDGKKSVRPTSALERLTERERQIIKLVVEGSKNKEIAAYLHISIKTVEKHRANLMKRLNLRNTSVLITFAIENGLVKR